MLWVTLGFRSVDETLMWDIQMNVIEQYFHVVLLLFYFNPALNLRETPCL